MIDLVKKYDEIVKVLDTINFERLWNGFKRKKFALYNKEMVVLEGKVLPKTDSFLANTSILYEGHHIAIWEIEEDLDTEILASKIVHEMFHAFQVEQGEKRYPNEISALIYYEYVPEYLQMRYEENLLLVDLVKEFCEKNLDKVLSIRKDRSVRFPYQYDYETKAEAIEGAATFVEMNGLKQMNIQKYEVMRHGLIHALLDMKKLFPARLLTYNIGALFLEICVSNGIWIDMSIGTTRRAYGQVLVDKTKETKRKYSLSKEIEERWNEEQTGLERILTTTLKSAPIKTGDFTIGGLNVFSARYYKGYIFTYNFLAYIEEDKEMVCYGDYIVKIEDYRIKEIFDLK